MSEDQKNLVDSPKETSSTEGKSETVTYETFRKSVAAEKSARERAAALEAQLEKLREEKMQAEGNKDELLKTYEEKAKTLEQRLKEKEQKFAWSTLTGEIEREALKHGCLEPKKLIRLLDDEDLRSIEVGENFRVNAESLSAVIEKSKKENSFLFSSTNKKMADGNPGNTVSRPKAQTESEIFENYIKTLK